MKHRSPDYIPRHRLERPLEKKRKSARAVASLALLGAVFSLNSDSGAQPEKPEKTIAMIEHPPVQETILLPGKTESDALYPNHPTKLEKTRKDKERYCKVADVPLPREFDTAEIIKGAQTEFAISTEEYREASEKLYQGETLEEIQDVMTPILRRLGVKAKYDEAINGYYKIVNNSPVTEETISEYANGMQAHMQALALMPRDMLADVEVVNFLNLRTFASAPGNPHNAAGLHAGHEITLAVPGAWRMYFIHEAAHSLHNTACPGLKDSELKEEHTDALKVLNSDESSKELEVLFKNEESRKQLSQRSKDDYIDQGKEVGLPDDYSRVNELEFMASKTYNLIDGRGLIPQGQEDVGQKDRAIHLKEMVVERMQKAMPNVDVPAYLQYMNTYHDALPTDISPEKVIERRISPYDGTNAYFERAEAEGDGRITPAVAVRYNGDTPDEQQYIYAFSYITDDKVERTEIIINTPRGNTETTDLLVEAAGNYLKSLPGATEENVHAERIRHGTGVDLVLEVKR